MYRIQQTTNIKQFSQNGDRMVKMEEKAPIWIEIGPGEGATPVPPQKLPDIMGPDLLLIKLPVIAIDSARPRISPASATTIPGAGRGMHPGIL